MTTDILDPAALISLLPTLLPVSSKILTSPQDAIAALLHSIFSAVAFRLIGIDESSSSASIENNVLPQGWNKDGPGHYTLKYKHDQSSLEFVLKVSKLGGRTLINSIAIESDRVASLDISTNDFVSPSFFPHDLQADSNGSPLVHGFISSNRVADLTTQIKLKLLQKLIPGLQKEGYTEEEVTSSTNAQGSNPAQAQDLPPSRPQPVMPPYAPHRSPLNAPENPLSIGRRDLDPFFPGNPFAPPPLFPGNEGDGMFVGPEHPIFNPGRGRHPVPWGGDGFLPQMGAPPGARFDPITPVPLRGEFGGLGRGGGIPRGPPTGEPDNDEFMPPGMRDMFMLPNLPNLAIVSTINTPPVQLQEVTHLQYREIMNGLSVTSSPTSPRSGRKKSIPAGFRPAPKPKKKIDEMTLRELQDLHTLNIKILSSPGASTSTYVSRVSSEQAQIENRLVELEGVERINSALRNARIKGEGDMVIDSPPEPPQSRTIEAKRKALFRFTPAYGEAMPGTLTLQEAINLEQQAHVREKERIERIAEKKRRLGIPVEGEVLTRQEREARIWAFMNHKPTESDMDDDDDDDDDSDDDPASWFEDDQDDGRKGQDIIEPDVEDLSEIIRIDESRITYSTFYQPRDDGD
ncbi:hypothetical protein C0989_012354 [Termitomyces sp. Mn162]|nr:hypothetical protein C0989_012354 [Termitomyces sp. Mn162]